MNRIVIIISLCAIFFSCKNDQPVVEEKDPILEEMGGKNYKDLIRIPVDKSGNVDTSNVAQITFDKLEYNMGDVISGNTRTIEIPFYSTGTKDLYILSGESSCGCTVADYPKDAIAPNDYGMIKVTFDSENRPLGPSSKHVILKTNTYPNVHELKLRINVIE